MYTVINKKKQELIDKFQSAPLKVGDKVYLTEEIVKSSYSFHKGDYYEILSVNDNEFEIILSGGYSSSRKTKYIVNKEDIKGKYGGFYIGKNPFDERFNNVRPVAYQLGSIIHTLELYEKRKDEYDINGTIIQECNWNPFVLIGGEKKYYQRDFVWTLEQNQLLIESIYKNIQCGTILIRKRGWNVLRKLQSEGETELSFADIVDGKQRLNAIRGFIKDEYKDLHGNYYSDLSNHAQHKFCDHQLFSYAEMPESTTDEEVLYQFLKMNHEGVPQSKEHLDYISNLLKISSK